MHDAGLPALTEGVSPKSVKAPVGTSDMPGAMYIIRS